MPVEQSQSQNVSYDVPKWAAILSWAIPLVLCATLIWLRETPWTKGTIPGIVMTYVFGWVWFRMAVRLVRGEPIPSFIGQPVVGIPSPTGWLESPSGTLLQATALLAAGAGLVILG